MKTFIKLCNCIHPMQDSMYGKGKRVMNLNKNGNSVVCTVCGRPHDKSVEATKNKR